MTSINCCILKETTLVEAIQRLLTDSRIADVELEGSDGVRLPGCRGLLAARSQVFERMLLGQFSETTDAVVKVGYPGNVLKKIVKYCYTDEVDLNNHETTTGECGKDFIHQLLLLADAANYFELSQLRCRIIEAAKAFLGNHPESSFRYLEEAKCVGCTEILKEALSIIQTHLPNLLSSSTDSIRALSVLSLMEVLEDTHSTSEERLLYQLLEVWVNNEEHGPSDLKQVAREQLSKCIRLDLIPASILERQVAIGGLVEELDIFLAYKEQAKQAEKEMELLHSRSSRRWKGSKSCVFQYDSEKETVEFLSCERLSSGIYQWTIVAENVTENMFIGVEGGKHDFWLGYNGVRWRDKVHNGQGQLGFRSKSVVSMTLDLTRGGTLKATVDESEPEILFSKMVTADDTSFVPAVCIKKAGSVRFVGLRKLE